MYRTFGKRAFDLALTVTSVPLLLPLIFIVAALVYLSSGWPILFHQQRPGLHGHPFTLLKFRTMTMARDSDGNLQSDSQRLTRVGKFLRSTSLDELPELLNVLSGSMSLVGPRPLLMSYLSRYDVYQHRRHDVLPGITGWAQVNGRNAIAWNEKFDFDLWYIDHVSFRLDARILLMTIGWVFSRHGIHAAGSDTMPEFQGNKSAAAETDKAPAHV